MLRSSSLCPDVKALFPLFFAALVGCGESTPLPAEGVTDAAPAAGGKGGGAGGSGGGSPGTDAGVTGGQGGAPAPDASSPADASPPHDAPTAAPDAPLPAPDAATPAPDAPASPLDASTNAGDGAIDGGLMACQPGPAAGQAPLRRLTAVQYARTVRDLLGVTQLKTSFPLELSFGSGQLAAEQTVTPVLTEAWFSASEELGDGVAADLPRHLACDAASAGEEPCVVQFLATFGLRAYRRPLTETEQTRLLALWNNIRASAGYADSVGVVARALLLSPHFLFRPELGVGSPAGTRLRLSDHEIAVRLSYTFWGTMPDAALFQAAQAGQLSTPEARGAQALRLWSDPRARSWMRELSRSWFDLERGLDEPKSAQDFPQYSAEVRAAVREEPYRYLEKVLFEGDARWSTLLSGTLTVTDDRLAAVIYAVSPGTALPRTQRVGLFTQAWFQAGRAGAMFSDPVARGMAVRERLLCQSVPPPPPDIMAVAPGLEPGRTRRELYAQHRQNPACAGCHRFIDPLGFPFEHYDAIGRFRLTENGLAIDASGELVGTDVDGPVANAVDLMTRLTGSETARRCMVSRVFENAYGRRAEEADGCEVATLDGAFKAADTNVRELFGKVASSDALATRPAAGVSPPTGGLPPNVDPGTARPARMLVLDHAVAETRALLERLTDPFDRMRLEQFLTGLREIERRLATP